MRALFPVFLLVAFALPACTTGSTGGTSDAGVIEAPLTCSTNAECEAAKLICDPIRRACVCTKDAMCSGNPGGPYCNTFSGKCVLTIAGCKSDAECSDNEFCDPALRTCRTKKGYCQTCQQDEECGGPEDFCIRHPDFATAPMFCSQACDGRGQCGAGQVCRDTEKGKQCVPEVGRCNANSACNPDSGQECTSDRNCTQGSNQVCDTLLSRCVAAESTCAPGQSCDPVTSQCVQACRRDQECVERYGDPNYQCRAQTCVRAETCTGDENCTSSKWCYKEPGKGPSDPGICAPACNSDAECPLGERCQNNPATARRRCAPGCVSDQNAGCPLNAICTAGQCEFKTAGGANRCQVREVCDFRQSCTNLSCIPQPDHCKSCAAGCGAGSCADMYTNVSIMNCNLVGCTCPVTCPDGARPLQDPFQGICACPIKRCVFRCTTDAQCPKGFSCEQVAVNGNSGPWCFPVSADPCR